MFLRNEMNMMRTYVPRYYFNFKCTAEKCKHNCCIGWEIDIDEDTYKYYMSIPGPFGQVLKSNIELPDSDDALPHFKLSHGDRCPFLKNDNLCHIISELSEDGLCQICKDHPRFRNYFTDHIEMGLGMSCEEAARIIITSPIEDAAKFIELTNEPRLCYKDYPLPREFNCECIPTRMEHCKIIMQNNLSFTDKLQAILNSSNASLPSLSVFELAQIYSNLEILDLDWKNKLSQLYGINAELMGYTRTLFMDESISLIFERILVYFLYRHITTEETVKDGTKFVVLSTLMIAAICRNEFKAAGIICDPEVISSFTDNNKSAREFIIETIIDISRMYSAEIEYSEENTNALQNL